MNLFKKLFAGKAMSQSQESGSGAIESILMVEDRDLYFSVRDASDDQRRRAVLAALRYAVACVNLHRAEIDEALSCLAVGARPSDTVNSGIKRLMEDLDQEDCDLQERRLEGAETSQPEQVSLAFRQARAASSVSSALSGKADEAVYEAIHAIQDLPKVREIVLSALRGI